MEPVWNVWLTRVGMVFDLFAFFLAAPEILGEEKLRAAEAGFRVSLRSLLQPGEIDKFASGVTFLIGILVTALVWILVPSIRQVFEEDLLGRCGFFLVQGLLLVILLWLLTTQSEKVIKAILRRLADDSRLRQRSLIIGAMLFVLGFLLQFAATF